MERRCVESWRRASSLLGLRISFVDLAHVEREGGGGIKRGGKDQSARKGMKDNLP